MINFVQFFYTILDKEQLNSECAVILNLNEAVIKGWREELIWNDRVRGFISERVFLIIQNGQEFGALVVDENIFNRCVVIPDDFRLFDIEFEFEFE